MREKLCPYYRICFYFRRSKCDDNMEDIKYCIHYKEHDRRNQLKMLNQGGQNKNQNGKYKRHSKGISAKENQEYI